MSAYRHRFIYAPMVDDGLISTDVADLETIDLHPGSALCDVDYTGDASMPTGGTGRSYAAANMRGVDVHLQVSLGNDRALAERLHALVSFAKDGGLIGYAHDVDYIFFAQMVSGPSRDDADFDYGANLLTAWGGLSTPLAGWKLYLQSPLPQMRREIVKVDSVAGTTVTTDDLIVWTYDNEGGFVIVRHKLFFPFLRYVSGDVVLDEHQAGCYRFDCMFREDVGQEQTEITSDVAEEVEVDPFLLILQHFEGIDSPVDWGTGEYGDLPVTYLESGSTELDDTEFKFGDRSGLFTGDGNLAVYGSDGNVHTNELSLGIDPDSILDMWVRPTTLPSSSDIAILFCAERSGSTWWRLGLDSTGRLIYTVTVSSSTTVALSSSTVCPVNTWTHVILSRHGGVTLIGVAGSVEDGASDHSDYSGFVDGATGGYAFGGRAVSGVNYIGRIDEARYKSGAYLAASSGDSYAIPSAAYSPP